MSNAGNLFSDEKWSEVILSLKEAANATVPDFSFLDGGDTVISRGHALAGEDDGDRSESGLSGIYTSLCDAKCRAAVQLLLIQTVMEIYNMYRSHFSAKNMLILFEALHVVGVHAHKINSNTILRSILQEFDSMTQMQDPLLLRLKNESFKICLTFYIEAADSGHLSETYSGQQLHYMIPLGSGKRRALATRAALVVSNS